jgi:CheY-like chemotaxis protein
MILPAQKFPPLDCLIIDYDDQDVQILSEILGQQGYQIRRALNANVALEYLQIKIPDIIFWNF